MKSTKTKKVKKINEKTVIAALDIGKNIQYGYFRAPNGNDVTPFPFYNSKKSYNAFWRKLCQFKKQEEWGTLLIRLNNSSLHRPFADFYSVMRDVGNFVNLSFIYPNVIC